MSNIFKHLALIFHKEKKFESGEGDGVVETSMGKCVVTTKDGVEVNYTCVQKIFDSSDSLKRAVRGYEFIHGKQGIREYFPEVYHIDEHNLTVRMAYFSCQSVQDYFRNTDIFDKTNEKAMNGVFLSINDLLQQLIVNRIRHTDLHGGNVLLCPSQYPPTVNLKVIDLDQAIPLEDTTSWSSDEIYYEDTKGSNSQMYADAGWLGQHIREDIMEGHLGRQREKTESTESTEKIQWRIEERLHEFSNFGKLSVDGWTEI